MHNSAYLGAAGVILYQKRDEDDDSLVNKDDLVDEVILDSILIFALENLIEKQFFHSSQSNIESAKDDICCKPSYFAIKRAIPFDSTLIVIIDQPHKEEMSNKEDDSAVYQVKPRYKAKHPVMTLLLGES